MSIKFLILAGIIIGLWLALSAGTFFVLLFLLFIFFILKSFIPEKDKPFIFKIVGAAFILRLVFLLLYYYFYLKLGNLDILGPDGEGYSQHAWYISRLLVGQSPYIVPNNTENIFGRPYLEILGYFKGALPSMDFYQIGAFTYFISILYALFDYSPLMMKLINSTFSILTGVMIYFIGKEIFNSKIGKISMALTVFLPSMVAHSIAALKDIVVIFLLTMIVWGMIKFQKNKNFLWPILILSSVVTIQLLRSTIVFPLLLIIISTLLFSIHIGIFKKCFIVLLAFILLSFISPFKNVIERHLNLNTLFSTHIGFVNTPGNNYKIFPDRCYYQSELVGVGPIEVIGAFAKGSFHLLCEPLPHKINSKTVFFAFPQTFLLYLFLPFMVIGLIAGLRHRAYLIMPLFLFLMIFIPLMAINEGNVGTVFRHRDMLMPFLIILGVAGCYAKLRGNIFAEVK